MIDSIHLSTLLTALFSEFELSGVSYLVLRNYEELPETTTNDVDFLIDPQQLKEAVCCLEKVALATGWTIHNLAEFSCWTFYLYHEATFSQVHIDFMCGIKWYSALFADHHIMFNARRRFKCFYIPSQEHEAAINLTTRLLYGGYVREKYRDGIANAATQVPENLFDVLSPWIGSQLAERFIEASKQRDWEQIERAANAARMRVVGANLRTPLLFLSRIVYDFVRLMRRLFDSPGISLVFVGSSDDKTSSIATEVAKAMPGTFSPERTLHVSWSPDREEEEDCMKLSGVCNTPLRNGLTSLGILLFWIVKFNYRWFRQVNPVVFRNGLVVLERYGYDLFLNPARYGLNLSCGVSRFFLHFIPKPDLVIFLDDSQASCDGDGKPSVFFRSAIEKLRNGRVVDASQSPKTIIEDVRAVVFGYMAGRAERRLRRFK